MAKIAYILLCHKDPAAVVQQAHRLTAAGDVMATIRESAGELLTDISLFDIYRGEQLGEGKKSLAFQLTFCATDRSLEEKEINELREAMLGPLEEKLGAKIRA